MPSFEAVVAERGLTIRPTTVGTLWVNITRRCNQVCRHCHLKSSPARTEEMRRPVIERCLEVLAEHLSIQTLDITGGAPELHRDFDYFATEARRLGKRVKVRTNLTVVLDGDPTTGAPKDYLPRFFAEHGIELIASLPHYEAAITDEVRGQGVFDKSLEVIRRLNTVGYGSPETGLIMDLVHNTSGPLTPAERDAMEARFKTRLAEHGLSFNRLYAVTNMPLGRLGTGLRQSGAYQTYLDRLVSSFSAEATEELVCQTLVNVGYDGRLYDCDFNQAIGLQIMTDEPMSIFNFDLKSLLARRIKFGPHCFGCTAGGGSS
jgi:radical SAM/Cys-rich protein